jgi:hypothetical protein
MKDCFHPKCEENQTHAQTSREDLFNIRRQMKENENKKTKYGFFFIYKRVISTILQFM